MSPVEPHPSPERFLERWDAERVCAALRPFVSERRAARIEWVLARRLSLLTVGVERLYDPHNAMAAVRTAEALGLSDFHLVEGPTKPDRKGTKVTLRADQWLDIHRHATTAACYAAWRRDGFAVWAAAPVTDTPLEAVPVDRPLALIFGNERDGLTPEAIETADGCFSIAMHGFTASYNLSVSVAISLYALVARRRTHTGADGDLPPSKVAELRARWYFQSVRAAAQILRQAGWPE